MSYKKRSIAPPRDHYAEDVQRWRAQRAAEQAQVDLEGWAETMPHLSAAELAQKMREDTERREHFAAKRRAEALAKKIRSEFAEQDMQAAQYRGVRYDPRIRKFVARFYDRRTGRDLWLGAHLTAAEAGAAYQAHFAKAPKKAETNAEAYARWRDTARVSEHPSNAGHVAVGEVCQMPDGQRFELVEVFQNGAGSRIWTEYHFASSCRECGETFFFSTSPNATGFTRNCVAHRRQKPRRAASKTPQEPEDGSDLV